MNKNWKICYADAQGKTACFSFHYQHARCGFANFPLIDGDVDADVRLTQTADLD